MNWMGLFLFLATAVTFFVYGMIVMAVMSAKEKEDVYTDAYKLGYEVGKKEGEKNGCEKVFETT